MEVVVVVAAGGRLVAVATILVARRACS